MQVSFMLISICHNIDQLTRSFIWKGETNKGIYLVGLNKVIESGKQGGLGVCLSREVNNIAMIGKLVWDIQHGSNKSWVSMLSTKYLDGNSLLQSPKTYV